MDQSGICKKSVKESENVGQERNNPLSGKIFAGDKFGESGSKTGGNGETA